MIKGRIDCIDSGTEFCPCKLAEANECLICSQLQGKSFCDCVNWNGVCIYQEFYDNGNASKKSRNTYTCKIISVDKLENELLMLKFETSHKLAFDLIKPGSYIFIRTDENQFFDIPISIMESNIETNIVTMVIEIRGIKTKRLINIKNGDSIVIRGPYWNGVFGLDDLTKQNNCCTLVLGRGIGNAPMMPAIRKLTDNKNEVLVYLDLVNYKSDFFKCFLNGHSIPYTEAILLNSGDLSKECKFVIDQSIRDKNITHIHLAGADILTYKVIEYLYEINRSDITLSCCNNFKMCCGEGICGACTSRFSGHIVKRFCKLQTDPRSIFEGRRLI